MRTLSLCPPEIQKGLSDNALQPSSLSILKPEDLDKTIFSCSMMERYELVPQHDLETSKESRTLLDSPECMRGSTVR